MVVVTVDLQRTTVITSASFEKNCFERNHLRRIRKKKKSPVRLFRGGKSRDTFYLLGVSLGRETFE